MCKHLFEPRRDLGQLPDIAPLSVQGTVVDAGDECWEHVAMAEEVVRPVRVPPRWFIRTAWKAHRALYRVTNGRKGLWTPANKRGWGALRLSTVGRRSGQDRAVIVGYLEDGPNLVVLAMNGWGEGEPAWWLNLQAHPKATVHLADGPPRRVSAHVARGAGTRSVVGPVALHRARPGRVRRSPTDADRSHRPYPVSRI